MKEAYEARTGGSRRLFGRARRVFAGGVSHNARFYEPYPLFVSRAQGSSIWDEDGNRYTDYWMGHMALILGHSPRVVVRALMEQIGRGTHYGMGSRVAVELGEEIQASVPCAELVRFCSSGAEATMYLVRLARGFTGKRTIVKMAGGWHGYNTDLNKGVHAPFDKTESAGILPEEQAHVVNVRFNDLEQAEMAVKGARGDVAAILVEPVLGAGGCIPADGSYLKGLRELCDRHGTLLAYDEIITGFRLALGGAQEWYSVKPDLATLGKVVGGGLPIGVVCGGREILSLADPAKKAGFVSIGGGTFSENPLTMSAGLATLKYLRQNRRRIYPKLNEMGGRLRSEVDRAFAEYGVETHTTGLGSLFLTHFGNLPRNAQESAAGDRAASREYALHLLSSGVFMLPGHPGAVSTAHGRADIDHFVGASERYASQCEKHAMRWARVRR
jgi:glutamate-1-semialdehyde 2,1-aminomutase